MSVLDFIDDLYRYALALSRNTAQAEDLVQETCLRALKASERLREDSNVKAWLFTILHNLWISQIRQSASAGHAVNLESLMRSAEAPADPSRNAYDLLISEEDTRAVRWAIARLPEEFRQVIILREFEEFSYKEIAEILNCPAGTVMSRLGRARSKLRAYLAEASTEGLISEKRSRRGRLR